MNVTLIHYNISTRDVEYMVFDSIEKYITDLKLPNDVTSTLDSLSTEDLSEYILSKRMGDVSISCMIGYILAQDERHVWIDITDEDTSKTYVNGLSKVIDNTLVISFVLDDEIIPEEELDDIVTNVYFNLQEHIES